MGGFKLGKMTLRSLFGKPETVRYPFEEPEHPAALRGKVVFSPENCIYCGICEKRCPTAAISVVKKEGKWSIDRFRCVQCGTCVRECPKTCLTMDPDYPLPSGVKSVDALYKPEPSEEEKAAKEAEKAARIKAAMEAKAAREAQTES